MDMEDVGAALRQAVEEGNLQTVKKLISQGAHVDEEDKVLAEAFLVWKDNIYLHPACLWLSGMYSIKLASILLVAVKASKKTIAWAAQKCALFPKIV